MRDCDHCRDGTTPTHRVTPFVKGVRQDHMHAYLCNDHMHKHSAALGEQGYGCVERRTINDMAKVSGSWSGLQCWLCRCGLNPVVNTDEAPRATHALVMESGHVDLLHLHIYVCERHATEFKRAYQVIPLTVLPQFRKLDPETLFLHQIPERT